MHIKLSCLGLASIHFRLSKKCPIGNNHVVKRHKIRGTGGLDTELDVKNREKKKYTWSWFKFNETHIKQLQINLWFITEKLIRYHHHIIIDYFQQIRTILFSLNNKRCLEDRERGTVKLNLAPAKNSTENHTDARISRIYYFFNFMK